MDSNTHSGSRPDWLAALTADLDGLAAEDLDRLPDTVRADRVMVLRGLADRIEGQWLKELAGVDARGAAGAEQGLQAGSTASWLRAPAADGGRGGRQCRADRPGPVRWPPDRRPPRRWSTGELSPAHAQVLAHGTQDLPDHLTAEAEPVLVAAARRLDPPRLRRVVAHLCCGRRPRGRRRPGRTPPPAPGAVAGHHLGGHGRGGRAAGGRGRPDPAGRPGAAGPPGRRRTTPAPVANDGLMPWSSWPAATWKPASCPNRVGSGPSCW